MTQRGGGGEKSTPSGFILKRIITCIDVLDDVWTPNWISARLHDIIFRHVSMCYKRQKLDPTR